MARVKETIIGGTPLNRSTLLVVAAALIDETGQVLVQQRPNGKMMAGLWEFPGGKVEIGETPENALVRELHEELGISVDVQDLGAACFASEPLGERHLLLLLYICRQWSGALIAREAPGLRWMAPAKLRDLPMPPADRPLIDQLEALI